MLLTDCASSCRVGSRRFPAHLFRHPYSPAWRPSCRHPWGGSCKNAHYNAHARSLGSLNTAVFPPSNISAPVIHRIGSIRVHSPTAAATAFVPGVAPAPVAPPPFPSSVSYSLYYNASLGYHTSSRWIFWLCPRDRRFLGSPPLCSPWPSNNRSSSICMVTDVD